MSNDPPAQPLLASASAAPLRPAKLVRPAVRFALCTGALCLCFCLPLYGLVRLAFHSELYSHALLIPFITLYLIRIKRAELWSDIREQRTEVRLGKEHLTPALSPERRGGLRSDPSSILHPPSSILLLAGFALLLCYGLLRWRGWQPLREDYLAFTILSFLCFLVGGGFVFLGGPVMKAVTFPLAMLLFLVPFPTLVKQGIEYFFQHTSADAASVLFGFSGTPVFRDGLIFHLPGISIQVAEECSGIRSSLVLFITGLLAAHLFLRTPWKRALLVLVVIPLGIVRNGFRIFTIGMLCVHVDPSMIDSPIHHRGGPIFFLLSLIPFFLILVWLRKSEKNPQKSEGGISNHR